MDAYVLVLIVFLLAWLISFLICDCEILAPPSLMLIMFVLATSLSIVGLGSWNAISLSPEAICCFVVMAISIVFGAVVFKAILPKRSLRSVARTSYDLVSSFCERVISIGMSRWLILIVVLIVGVLVYSGELVALADQNGMTSANYFSKARWVREHYNVTFSTESLDSGAGFSGIASRFQQIIMFSGYVGALVIAACVWKRAEKKYYVGPTIVLLIACAFALLKGARGDIVHYVLALVIALFAFKMSNTKSKAETSKRFALAGAVLLMVVLVLFYLGGVLLRSTGANLVDYVSFYFGCGIPSLSSILEESSNASTMLGSTTFSQLFISLYKYGFVDTVQANASFL